MGDLSDGFKGCPFCGDKPEVSNLGTFIEIDCCVSMSFQKSDIFEEKLGQKHFDLDMDTLLYSQELEEVALNYAKENWNTRADV